MMKCKLPYGSEVFEDILSVIFQYIDKLLIGSHMCKYPELYLLEICNKKFTLKLSFANDAILCLY